MPMPAAQLASSVKPFPGFAALDGCHCVTNSLAKIFHYFGHPLSEEMLFGLGAGMGFVYWRMKMGASDTIFVGGRGNPKNFFRDIGERTGVVICERQTSSVQKAQAVLLGALAEQKPVMLGADMGMLPWFDLPADYHFGGHTFVACGYDGDKTVLASDIEQKASGRKPGFYAEITLEQLRKARSSPFKPFPPKNLWLEFGFKDARKPNAADIESSIRQTIDAQLNPPIRNLGIRGMRHTADELLKWPDQLSESALRMNLFNLYIFIEIGGTGGGCFRYMYSRFLKEAAEVTGNRSLLKSADQFEKIGQEFSRIGLMFKDAARLKDLARPIQAASNGFRAIAEQEEEACRFLERSV